MEFEDGEEQHDEVENEIGLTTSHDSQTNSNPTRPTRMPASFAVDAPPLATRKPRYRECLRNHAVSTGGHAIDGCGEFMPAGADGTDDALKCAACSCHRNFHRRETTGPNYAAGAFFHQQQQPPPPPLLTHYPHGGQFSTLYRTPSGYLQVTPPHRPLALPSNSGGGYREEQEDATNPNGGSSSRKRFRTKFTAEQKEKMLEVAESLGWRIQKQDEEAVQQLCNELGIRRHVFKVWMHNNKHTLGKKP